MKTACVQRMGAVLFLLIISANGVPAIAAEPTVALPPSARVFSIGEHIVVNGMPMRIIGFKSTESVAELAKWFRRSLGQPLVENKFNNTLILGKAVDSHYLTVQLAASANGTQGVAAVSDLKTGEESRHSNRDQNERWLSAFSSAARVLTSTSSEDRGKRSRQVVILDDESESACSARLQALLKEDGLLLEREAKSGARNGDASVPELGDARTLYFKGEGREAMATISRNEQGRTVIVVNTISTLNAYR